MHRECRRSRPRIERLEDRSMSSPAAIVGTLAAGSIERSGPGRGMHVFRNLAYRPGAGPSGRLDVYVPTGPTPDGGRPTILAIHGGGWRRFDKADYGGSVARLVREGYVVVAANYTLSAPGRPSWPKNLEDVREAVRWTRLNASRFGIDPERVVAMGESAGGHLAALLGTYPDGPVTPDVPPGSTGVGPVPGEVSARVDAVIDFYGPADLADLTRQSPSAGKAVRQFLGGDPAQRPGRSTSASPTALASPDDAPTLIVHGTADTLVPIAQSEALAAALARAGVPTQFIALPGAAHGFRLGAAGGSLVPAILAFLGQAWEDV